MPIALVVILVGTPALVLYIRIYINIDIPTILRYTLAIFIIAPSSLSAIPTPTSTPKVIPTPTLALALALISITPTILRLFIVASIPTTLRLATKFALCLLSYTFCTNNLIDSYISAIASADRIDNRVTNRRDICIESIVIIVFELNKEALIPRGDPLDPPSAILGYSATLALSLY